MDFVETIERCFAGRKRHGGIDERWAELKKSVLKSAHKTPIRQMQEAQKVDDRRHH